jgi:hypothetical protein
MSSANAGSLKISQIEGEDFGGAQRFCCDNDRSDGDNCEKDFSYGVENFFASSVLGILRIKQGNERSGIDKNLRRDFRRNPSCMPRHVSVKSTIAYPPGPRSRRR